MSKRISPSRAACAAGALGLAALAGGPAAALQIDNGDVVGIFVKNGAELVVNLGPFEPGAVDLSGLFSSPAFDGSPADAKFVALAVEDPDRTVVCCGVGVPLPQENIIYTSEVADPTPDDGQIERAMNGVDVASPSATVWFNLLRSLSGVDSELIESTANYSYENVLGLGTDAIGNNFTFSTAGQVDSQGRLAIPLYSDVRGYADFGGPATVYGTLGEIRIDGKEVSFAVPEAAAMLQTAGGAAVLLAWAARRRRTAVA